MITVIWIATIITVLGSIHLIASTGAGEESIVTARADETR